MTSTTRTRPGGRKIRYYKTKENIMPTNDASAAAASDGDKRWSMLDNDDADEDEEKYNNSSGVEENEEEDIGYTLLISQQEEIDEEEGETSCSSAVENHNINNDQNNDNNNNVIPPDYISIANNLLAQLHEEYSSMHSLGKEEEEEEEEEINNTSTNITCTNKDKAEISETTETLQPAAIDLDEEYITVNEVPSIAAAALDSNRIQGAIQSIVQKQIIKQSSNNFVQKMEVGWTNFIQQQQQKQQQQPKHSIIPSLPLAAFSITNTTDKALQASCNLSRSATLAELMVRLPPAVQSSSCHPHHNHLPSLLSYNTNHSNTKTSNSRNVLTIHIVGADRVECSTSRTVQKLFAPWVRWMEAYLQKQQQITNNNNNHYSEEESNSKLQSIKYMDEIQILLIGPNIPLEQNRIVIDLLPKNTSTRPPTLKKATATCINCLYHEYLQQQQQQQQQISSLSSVSSSNVVEDLIVVAFNAGIWGYNDWYPTIQMLAQYPRKKIPFIVTAYTIEESIDDLDTIEEILQGYPHKRILWNPERNPFQSRLPRKTITTTTSTIYYENAAWQAWELGGGESII
jgi:hypothetical protein